MQCVRCRKASKEKEALERALLAARQEAVANADLGNSEAYMADAGGSSSEDDGDRLSSDTLHRITAEVRRRTQPPAAMALCTMGGVASSGESAYYTPGA